MGRYMAMSMPPTIVPMTTIITGSMGQGSKADPYNGHDLDSFNFTATDTYDVIVEVNRKNVASVNDFKNLIDHIASKWWEMRYGTRPLNRVQQFGRNNVKDPMKNGLISITAMQAGEANNVIPQTALLKGEGPGVRKEFHYVTDDGDYAAFRYGKWKISFLTQEKPGFDVWDAPYVPHRCPRICDLRADPFEHAQHQGNSFTWQDWQFKSAPLVAICTSYCMSVVWAVARARSPRFTASPPPAFAWH